MGNRALQRTGNTMQQIMLAYKHKGKQPSLTAVTTIYGTLLRHAAAPNAATEWYWEQFGKLAALPLTEYQMVPSCQLDPDSNCCGYNDEGAACRHKLVAHGVTVHLGSNGAQQLADGRVTRAAAQTPGSAQWAKQIGEALAQRATA